MRAIECAGELLAALIDLEQVVSTETNAAAAGRIHEALSLLEAKNAAFARYRTIAALWQAMAEATAKLPPATLATLRDRHHALARALQQNHMVLTTTRSVSEELLREVSSRIARPAPAAYGPPGQNRPAPASAPISLSRSS